MRAEINGAKIPRQAAEDPSYPLRAALALRLAAHRQAAQERQPLSIAVKDMAVRAETASRPAERI